ncbi:hypothetical protein DIE18_31060 [Burkholderia sp. Bp9125]|nr:hypothetical protein DIE18_31060 [Burkholderia sp. Bp9125]
MNGPCIRCVMHGPCGKPEEGKSVVADPHDICYDEDGDLVRATNRFGNAWQYGWRHQPLSIRVKTVEWIDLLAPRRTAHEAGIQRGDGATGCWRWRRIEGHRGDSVGFGIRR